MGAICVWQDMGGGLWKTDCKDWFEFIRGEISENRFHFCPFCGAKIQEEEE